MYGAFWQKGRPAGPLGTLRSLCELTLPHMPGHEACSLVGTLPVEPCPVPWAGLGSDLTGKRPGLGCWPSLSLPFILGPSTGDVMFLFLGPITYMSGTVIGT